MKLLIIVIINFTITVISAQENPNILLIIADDMGADVMPGYGIGTNLPNTPNLDKLSQSGLTFTNVWATPVCASTRASIMTGKYGVNNGVTSVPGILSTDHTSIFKQIKQQTNNDYATCLVGKWHLGETKDYGHPFEHGVDEFMGVLESGVTDYYEWNKVENQNPTICYEYATAYFTNYAIDWINEQSKPWLMWLAHVSPHTPFHYPPEGTYTKDKEGTAAMKKYLSMIENLDYEIGRLLDSIPNEVLENTIVIFVGDNGTPGNLVQGYNHGKGTLYQGGIHVPMIISGKGVSRKNDTENAHINICDLFATMAHFSNDLIGNKGGMYNSLSFKHLLSNTEGYTRQHNYMELGKKAGFPNDAFTIRNDQYKMIQFIDSIQEFYDLVDDPFETKNLLQGTISSSQQVVLNNLEKEANVIRTGWSCQDGIQNGEETSIDSGSDCNSTYISELTYDNEMIVYPSPFDSQITIVFKDYKKISKVQLINSVGQVVENIPEVTNNNITIITKNYNPGLYFISAIRQNGIKVFFSKIIKK